MCVQLNHEGRAQCLYKAQRVKSGEVFKRCRFDSVLHRSHVSNQTELCCSFECIF